MKPQFKTLIKKELYEFRYNYKAWFLSVLCIGGLYVPTAWNRDAPVFFSTLFVLLSVGQYIYNSYATETNYGGGIFIHNIGVNFIAVFLVKLGFAFIIAAVIFIADIPNLKGNIKLYDFLWIVPLIICGIAMMQLCAVFSKGSEDTSATITNFLFLGITVGIALIEHLYFRIPIAIVLATLLVYICQKVSNSLKYRAQL